MRVKFQKTIKKKERFLPAKKKYCRFCAEKVEALDYKDVKKLEMFIRERGKIVPSRVTGNCAKHQRRMVEALKQARFISLIPYTRV